VSGIHYLIITPHDLQSTEYIFVQIPQNNDIFFKRSIPIVFEYAINDTYKKQV